MQLTKLKNLCAWVLAILLPVCFFSPFKPIWIDELLQFVMGAYGSAGDAWEVFISSMKINHGQTGAYFIADYVLLRVFGASLIALRFPSLIAGIYTYLLVLIFMRSMRMSVGSQIVGLCLVALTPWLNFLFSDARPYAMVTLTAAAALVYFFSWITDNHRSRKFRYFSLPALLLGAVFHPYFVLYFLAVGGFGFLFFWTQLRRPMSFREGRSYLSIYFPFLVFIYFLIAKITWLAHPAGKFGFNPYEFLRTNVSPWRAIFSAQLEALEQLWLLKPMVGMVMALAVLVLVWSWITKRKLPEWGSGVILFWLAVGLSVIVSWASIRQEYWVLPRQWAGSYLLIAVSMAWSSDKILSRMKNTWKERFSAVVASLFLILVAKQFVVHLNHCRTDYQQYLAAQRVALTRYAEINVLGQTKRLTTDDWIGLANGNAAAGGSVWPIFRDFYPNQ